MNQIISILDKNITINKKQLIFIMHIFSKCKEKNHKGKLVAKLSRHCQYIPPIEEAFNSLQNFLQEDFPKLIKDINPLSPIALTESESEKNIKNEANKNCGCFAALPVSTYQR